MNKIINKLNNKIWKLQKKKEKIKKEKNFLTKIMKMSLKAIHQIYNLILQQEMKIMQKILFQ